MGYTPGLAFLGTVKLRVLWGLAQVLVHISTVKINIRRSTRVRKNQFVNTVNEINRFYMRMQRCVNMTRYDFFSFLHDKVVVQQKLIQWWSQNFIPWAVIYGVVITTMFLHEWVWGLVFIFNINIACFHNFITEKSTQDLVMKN